MKERQILFSAPMVRALLAGTKTQTRRVVKPTSGPHSVEQVVSTPDSLAAFVRNRCPYGQPGDRLWVRETWSGEHCYQQEPPSQRVSVMTQDGPMFRDVIWYWADGEPDYGDWERPRPSIHMPRYASRITLEVTGVRVERLQDISIEDAKAEGAWGPDDSIVGKVADYFGVDVFSANPRKAFQMLWESINGTESWAANPWVWVVEFKRLEAA